MDMRFEMCYRMHAMRFFLKISLLLTCPLGAAENARLEFAHGVLEELRGMDTAQDHFERARLADPLALPLVQRAVKQRLERDDRAGAVKLFQELATARSDELQVQLLYADFLTQEGAGDAMAVKLASGALETALKKHPASPAVIQRLYQIYQTSGRGSQAKTLLDQLDAKDAESALLYASLVRSSAEADEAAKLARLDEHYLLAMAANPQIAALARDASEHFRNTKRPEKAIELLEHHVAAAPSSLDLRTRLGVICFAAGRNEKGEAVLKAVLQIDPNDALAHQALAKFYRSHGQAEPALFHASERLKLKGGSAADFLKLADEWLAAGNPKAARVLLEKAVFDQPENWPLSQQLAIATRRDPETQAKAARIFREAELVKPPDVASSPEFLLESAEAMLAEGQSKAAEERLRAAIKAFPPDAKKETSSALRRLASIWESENRNADAAKSLRKRADSLDP